MNCYCAIYLLNKMIILVSIYPLLKFLFINGYKDIGYYGLVCCPLSPPYKHTTRKKSFE